ncbi:hypothetical protein EIP91_011367 [Steccherinum ochraceum]|uniref:Uncharacterized protein n=1 Tax=Steccherinum ochraceum TaxID=92696 RepID=A0A4R0RPW0_9APHY|nr:hypothetical protein EIP91_011367 [Steccherinum ochraceum]
MQNDHQPRPSLKFTAAPRASDSPADLPPRRAASPVASIFSLRRRTGNQGFSMAFANRNSQNHDAADLGDVPVRSYQEPPRPASRLSVKLSSSDDDAFGPLEDTDVFGEAPHAHISHHSTAVQAPFTLGSRAHHKDPEETSDAGGQLSLSNRLSQRFAIPRPGAHHGQSGTASQLEDVEDTDSRRRRRTEYVQLETTGSSHFTRSAPSAGRAASAFRPSQSPSMHRASSVALKGGDDISEIMMQGAADLRSTKMEVEELRHEVASLRTQLDTAQRDKEECLHRIQSVKDSAKKSLESSARSLDSMKSAMDELKAQSQESFGFANQTKVSLIDIEELKNTVAESLNSIQPLMDEDGGLLKIKETKEILEELQSECKQGQQVSDILRERLQVVGADLIDARARVADLEAMQVSDRDALRRSSDSLSNTMEQVNTQAGRLEELQERLCDALAAAADAEAKVAAAQDDIDRLHGDAKTKVAEIDQLRSEQAEIPRLRTLLEERDASIALLQRVEEQLKIVTEQHHEASVKISSLESQLGGKDELISDLRARLKQTDHTLLTAHQERDRALQDLAQIQVREDAQKMDISRMTDELKAATDKIESLEAALQDSTGLLAARNEKLSLMDGRYQMLEERFEDQSVTLKITKEANGDLQERLVDLEAKSARELEAAAGKQAVLDEQKATLHQKVQALELNVRELKETVKAEKKEHDAKMKQQQDVHHAALERELERTKAVQDELQSSRSGEQTLAVQALELSNQLQDANAQLREGQSASSQAQVSFDNDVAQLNSQLEHLKAENAVLCERSQTIEARYRNGELNSQEQSFIDDLVKTTQSIHHQELVTKGNELRRRDNTIAEMQSKLKMLEATIAKLTKTQSKVQTTSAADERSLLDITAWTASQRGSSPMSAPQAIQEQDDRPLRSTLKAPAAPRRPLAPQVLVAPSVDATPVPARPRPAVATKAVTTPANRPARDPQTHNTDKKTFGKLACTSPFSDPDYEHSSRRLCENRSPVKLGKRSERPETSLQQDADDAVVLPKRQKTYGRTTRRGTKQTEEVSVPAADKQLVEAPVLEACPRVLCWLSLLATLSWCRWLLPEETIFQDSH